MSADRSQNMTPNAAIFALTIDAFAFEEPLEQTMGRITHVAHIMPLLVNVRGI